MKKINIISILLICVLCIQSIKLFSQHKDMHSRSKQLTNYFNELRRIKYFPEIEHDSIIDNVTNKILLNDRKYRNSTNAFNEDSVRYLLFNEGIIDYKIEIKESLDKDTSSAFNAFFLADTSPNTRIGYSRNNGKHLLIKTHRYLKFDHGEGFVPHVSIQRDPKTITQEVKLDVKVDSLRYYVCMLNLGKYKYHYSAHIPSEKESFKNDNKYEPLRVTANNKGCQNIYFDLIFTSKQPGMYLIVTNEKNEKVAIFK